MHPGVLLLLTIITGGRPSYSRDRTWKYVRAKSGESLRLTIRETDVTADLFNNTPLARIITGRTVLSTQLLRTEKYLITDMIQLYVRTIIPVVIVITFRFPTEIKRTFPRFR